MIAMEFRKDSREQAAEFMDNLKKTVLEALDRGQILEMKQHIGMDPVHSDVQYGQGLPIDYVYTGEFLYSVGTRGFRPEKRG